MEFNRKEKIVDFDMKNKICLITGGNAGIGKETAIGLARMGATIVIVCKNKAQGEETIQILLSISQNNNHKLLIADLSDFDSLRNCVKEFKSQFSRLDVLINNAGVFYTKLTYTKNNIEMQFAVNHLAPFLMSHLLLDTLKCSGKARILNLSSISHYFGKIHFNDLFFEKRKYRGMAAYEQSKLASVLFTYHLAKLLKDTDVTVNSIDPGRVNTDVGNKNASGIYKYLWILNKPLLISPEKGAATSIYVATSKNLDGVSGKYFKKCKIKKSSYRSYDENIAKKLWDISAELTSLIN